MTPLTSMAEVNKSEMQACRFREGEHLEEGLVSLHVIHTPFSHSFHSLTVLIASSPVCCAREDASTAILLLACHLSPCSLSKGGRHPLHCFDTYSQGSLHDPGSAVPCNPIHHTHLRQLACDPSGSCGCLCIFGEESTPRLNTTRSPRSTRPEPF